MHAARGSYFQGSSRVHAYPADFLVMQFASIVKSKLPRIFCDD